MKQMRQVFTILGYPYTLVSDNGTQFTSKDFQLYIQTHNNKYQLTSPYCPHANIEVERFNRTIKKIIKSTLTEETETRKKTYNNPH